MRLLIDECVDERLRLLFQDHDCQTARFANLAGMKNGRLLEAAEAAGFDILITVDQTFPISRCWPDGGFHWSFFAGRRTGFATWNHWRLPRWPRWILSDTAKS